MMYLNSHLTHLVALVLQVPSLEPVHVLEGHRGIIYSLCWDPSDSLLVSASADSIVK